MRQDRPPSRRRDRAILKEFREFILHGSAFRYGDFINALLTFVLVATVLFFFFVIKPVNALLSRMRTEPPVAEETHQCPECLSEIPVADRRRAFCTTQVSAAR